MGLLASRHQSAISADRQSARSWTLIEHRDRSVCQPCHTEQSEADRNASRNVKKLLVMLGNRRVRSDISCGTRKLRKIDSKFLIPNGAGEGNRTLVFSLEGCCSTIELHPRLRRSTITPRTWPQPLCAGLVSRNPKLAGPRRVSSVPGAPLNRRRFAAYTQVSINNERR